MDFERERDQLTILAYRMLGSVQAAEDVVQEAWLRWARERPQLARPGAWLRTVVSRLCLDELGSARARRETYPGPWLPEPWVDGRVHADLERQHDLSLAMLLVLETLPPRQRVALVLREALDVETDELADILGTSPAGVRQLLRRARRSVARQPCPPAPAPDDQAAALGALALALGQGDVAGLAALLQADARMCSDGGGLVGAARLPVLGGPKIARALVRLTRLLPPGAGVEWRWLNQRLAVVVVADGQPHSITWVELGAGGVQRLWSLLQPDKLRALSRPRAPAPR